MKKNNRKPVAAIFSLMLAAALFLSVCGCSRAKSVVCRETSPDGTMEITIYQIGDPEFPYGPTHCSALLETNGKETEKITFDIANDGVDVTAEEFEINWTEDGAEITVSGSEQEEQVYQIAG